MANKVRILGKHGKSAARPRTSDGSGVRSSFVKIADHTWRSHALNRWGRGFTNAEGPPPVNEWTRPPGRGRMAP